MASRLKGEGRSGGIVVEIGKEGLKYSETYEFLVETDDKDIGRAEVLLTTGLPILNESVSVGGPAVCNHLDGERHPTNPFYWNVKASFSSDVVEGQDGSNNPVNVGEPPTAWVAKAKIRFERYDEIVATDANDDPFVNSAGQPFLDGITIPKTIACLDFVQFESAATDIDEIMDRNGVVNSATFLTKAAKTLQLTVQSAERGFYYGVACWLIYYTIKYKRDNWKLKKRDVGMAYLESGDLKPYEINDVVILGGLNGAGAKVAAGDPPAVLEFEPFPAISFSFLRVT